MHSGLDLLGADQPAPHPMPVGRTVLAVGAGVLGALLVPKHRVLAFLDAAALASNLDAVRTKERTLKEALKRMGRHVVATAGSLTLPGHPIIGYVAGAMTADLFISGDGGGMIDEWAEYEGIQDRDVIDAKFTVEPIAPSTSLTKVPK